MIFIIALLHAVPVFAVAMLFKRRGPVWISAVVMAVIGSATGASAYTGIDLAVVALATWLCVSNIPVTAARTTSTSIGPTLATRATAAATRLISSLLRSALLLGAVFLAFAGAVIGYNRYYGECADSVLSQQRVTFEQCRAALSSTRRK